MFLFALADAIITFILGWPCALYLVIASNFHRDNVESEAEENNEGTSA